MRRIYPNTVGFLAFLTAVNCYNVRLATRFNDTFTITKVAALACVIVAGVAWLALGEWEQLASLMCTAQDRLRFRPHRVLRDAGRVAGHSDEGLLYNAGVLLGSLFVRRL